MSQPRPSFIDSPYFIMECDNWHLTDDAPEELKKEFEEYMKSDYSRKRGEPMSKIIARGKCLGIERQVECTLKNGIPIIEIDGEYDEAVQSNFNQLLKKAPAIGGTYYPPENSLLAAYSVLESVFFDDGSIPTIEAIGDIGKIPTYDIEGIVY